MTRLSRTEQLTKMQLPVSTLQQGFHHRERREDCLLRMTNTLKQILIILFVNHHQLQQLLCCMWTISKDSVQAGKHDKPCHIFKVDGRFCKLHNILEKIMCIPATSAPVERIFCHRGLFMRPHRARLGPTVSSQLVFSKCNKYLNNK